MEILTPWTGEILVLSMLLVLNARIFWTRRTRIDALSLLGPFSVLTVLFEILAWGIRFSNVAILALALVCALANYRSVVRFSQSLFVDTYSVKFFVASALLLAITIFFLAVEIKGRPVRLQTRRYNVKIEREYFSAPLLSDSFELKKAKEAYDRRNMSLYTFSNKDGSQKKDGVILFVPDVLAESLAYEPYFILLARKGWTVLSADLYDLNIKSADGLKKTKFLRRASLLWDYFSSGGIEGVRKQKGKESRSRLFHEVYESSYRALKKIAEERYPGKKILVAADSSAFLPEAKLRTIFSDADFLNLQRVHEYKTPGFGFVPQTNPFFSWFFLGIRRDKTSFEPSWCATQTIKILEQEGEM